MSDSEPENPPISRHDPENKDRRNRIDLPRIKPGEPTRFRVATITSSIPRQPPAPPEHIKLWFRTRHISATSTYISHHHPHVRRLSIRPSAVARFLDTCVRQLPLPPSIRSWIQTSVLPEWFLPDRIVLKIQKGAAEDDVDETIARELFDTELAAYERLKPLQGVVVPVCYGQATTTCYGYDDRTRRRALLLEDLGGRCGERGVSLASPEGATLQLQTLCELLLRECYAALAAFGVRQDDPQPGNFLLVASSPGSNSSNKRLMALDFEMAEFNGVSAEDDDNAFFTASDISHLVGGYRELQLCFLYDRLLEEEK